MSLVEWKTAYAIGNPAVDYEHRELIELINALHRGLRDPAGRLGTGEFLGELYARIAAHFALEEQIMLSRGYDQYDDHKADHERLLDDIREMMDEFEDAGQVDLDAFGRRLELWFTEHFKTRDARLHSRLG